MDDERLGQIVGGRYRLDAIVHSDPGRSAFSAFDLDLDQPVVLHLFRQPALDEEGLRKFRSEARVLSRLRHPNIVEVLGCGQLEDNTPFVVLPFVDGQTLAEILEYGAFSADSTVQLILEVAKGLRFAHQFNVFHMALTPRNIVLGERTQIVDFFGSRWHHIDESLPVVRELTAAPPEVLRGNAPDAAADVYALGLLGYACLVGEHPVSDDEPSAAQAAHMSPQPWSLPDVSIPAELADVLLGCLNKEHGRRLADCDEVISELEKLQASTASTQRLQAIKPSAFFPSVGEVVAEKYVIEAMVGQGGFARVYRARSTETQRPIALKILRPDRTHDTPEARRFEREGKLVFSLLTNPHTISVYGYGETEESLLYIAFEFIDGQTLGQILDGGKFSPQRVVSVLEQCLVSLAEAHGMGVLHRDIKPSNIMLSDRDGVPDWVTVLDFGVAKLTTDILDPRELTAAGKTVGTPRYMAPEQIVGETLGPESDLYSLGLVAYELLTGDRAIEGDSVLDILAAQVDPQSVILPTTSHVPAPLAMIVNRLLRKERTSRYLAARDVLADLRQLERDVGDRTLDTGAR